MAWFQRPTLIRTSSRMARIARVRLDRPDADRPCKPPATRFSCTYVAMIVMWRCSFWISKKLSDHDYLST
jgi:hypothetical protein